MIESMEKRESGVDRLPFRDLQSQPQPGSTIGHFVVRREIGKGGMGVVYEARDENLQRDVAIKLIRTAKNLSDKQRLEQQQRLLREAQAMALISHPNLVTIYEVGKHGGDVFLAMEFITGMTLERWILKGQPLTLIVDAFCQAGEALQAVHEAGLVHRDFKPSNVIVTENGTVKLLDLGIARRSDLERESTTNPDKTGAKTRRQRITEALGRDDIQEIMKKRGLDLLDTSLTHIGDVVGTPGYIAPEQLYGQSVGPKADQFAFAVALYEALEHTHPYAGEDEDNLITKTVLGDFIGWSEDTAVPTALREVIEKGITREPGQRFESMTEMIDACRNAVGLRGQLDLLAKRWISHRRDPDYLLRSRGLLREASSLLEENNLDIDQRDFLQRSIEHMRKHVVWRRVFLIGVAVLGVGGAGIAWSLHRRNANLEARVREEIQESIRQAERELISTLDEHRDGVELLAAQRGVWLPMFAELREAAQLEPGAREEAVAQAVERLNDLFLPFLHRNEAISSLMVATKDSEYMALEDPDGPDLSPPYRDYVRVVDRTAFGLDAFQYFGDFNGNRLRIHWLRKGARDARGQLWEGYMPAARPGFDRALREGKAHIAWTEPYLFFTTKDPGVTASMAFRSGDETVVLGVDFLLTDISFMTAKFHEEDFSVLVVTDRGEVIGLPADDRFSTREAIRHFYSNFDDQRRKEIDARRTADASAKLPGVDDLGLPAISAGYEAGRQHDKRAYTFGYRGEVLHAGRRTVRVGRRNITIYVLQRPGM